MNEPEQPVVKEGDHALHASLLKLADAKTQETLKTQCAGPADLLEARTESLPGDE